MTNQLTAVYVKREDWYIAYLEEIPGVNTQGKTLEEARANLADALNEFMEANRMLSETDIPDQHGITRETFALVESAA